MTILPWLAISIVAIVIAGPLPTLVNGILLVVISGIILSRSTQITQLITPSGQKTQGV